MLRRVGIAASVAAAGAATLQRRAAESHAAAPAPESLAAQRPPSVVRVAPLDDPPDVTLEYFALRGLGELPRLILELTGIPYDSVYHFGTGVYKPYAPFGQLPVLRDGPLLICESGAIARHLARKACIDGGDAADKARVDMFFELAKDLTSKKSGIHDPASADGKRLAAMLATAEANCGGAHFVGSSTTLADVALFHALHTFDEVAPGSLEPYPKLKAFVKKFAAQPAIAEYLHSDRRVPLTANEDGKQPHSGLPGYKFKEPLRPGTYATPWSPPGA